MRRPPRRVGAGAARFKEGQWSTPVDYHMLLKYPDRDEPENADFTSFTGKITEGDILSLPEKGEWRVEEVRTSPSASPTSSMHGWLRSQSLSVASSCSSSPRSSGTHLDTADLR